MASKTPFLLIAALASVAIACGSASAQQVEGIAAVVNDEPITTLDVRDRMRLIISSAGIQPTEEMLTVIQEQALDTLVDETLQLQAAREFEVDVSEDEVNDSLRDIAARNGMQLEDITSDLEARGIGVETLRRQIRAEIAWQILVSGRYRSRIRVSDAQIQVALDRIIRNSSEPQVRLGEILIEVPASGDETEARQLVQAVYQELSTGTPFQVVAQQISAAPSASNGGDAGWQAVSQLRPQVQGVINAFQQTGQISNPLRVPGGYLIIALIDRREGAVVEQLDLVQVTLPTAQVTDQRRQQLTRAMSRLDSCDNVEGAVSNIEGVFVTALGSISSNALIDSIRSALSGLEPVSATAPLDTAAGLQSFVLCGREFTGAGVPTAEEVEDQLIGQQLSLQARRWLRDMRAEATVDIR